MNERWVDGFNVIHRLPELAGLLESDPEECRTRFLRLLAPLVFRSGERWTVVFDGPRSGRGRAAGPIDIIYSQDADAWILAELRRRPRPGAITIVSSDEKDIGIPAREIGAQVLSADALVGALGRRQAAMQGAVPESPEKPEEVDEEDVDYWLDQFGGGHSGEPKGDL